MYIRSRSKSYNRNKEIKDMEETQLQGERENRKRRKYRKVLTSANMTFTIFLEVKLALWPQFTDGKTKG